MVGKNVMWGDTGVCWETAASHDGVVDADRGWRMVGKNVMWGDTGVCWETAASHDGVVDADVERSHP
jgi:hypothetical protein